MAQELQLGLQIGVPALVAVAIFGLGLFLKPIIEAWYARRHDTLVIVVTDTPIDFTVPTENMKINWDGEEISDLYQTKFRIENRTPRTLRNVKLEIVPVGGDANHIYEIVITRCSRARLDVPEEENDVFDFEFIEPKAEIRGHMISSQSTEIEFSLLSDHEVKRMDLRDTEAILRQANMKTLLALLGSAAASALAGILALNV